MPHSGLRHCDRGGGKAKQDSQLMIFVTLKKHQFQKETHSFVDLFLLRIVFSIQVSIWNRHLESNQHVNYKNTDLKHGTNETLCDVCDVDDELKE